MRHIIYLSLLILIVSSSCKQNTPVIEDFEAYSKNHAEWQTRRLEGLKAETGWLNLAGLFWLEEGVNNFGSDASNSIVFPEHFPAYGGEIILADSTINIKVDQKITVTAENEAVEEIMQMFSSTAYKTSIALAKEKGSFPNYQYQGYKESKFVKNLPQEIRDEIKVHGIRNATILTVAPTGSGAIVAQVSSGVEPIFNVSYTRRVKKNEGFG